LQIQQWKILFSEYFSLRYFAALLLAHVMTSTASKTLVSSFNLTIIFTHFWFFTVKPKKLLISFSVVSNTKDLFNFNRNESEGALSYLGGLKGAGYAGIIMIHSILNRIWFPSSDPREAEFFFNSLFYQFFDGLFYHVDTFLLISGFLMTRTVMKELNK
jgi:hypothetical protein